MFCWFDQLVEEYYCNNDDEYVMGCFEQEVQCMVQCVDVVVDDEICNFYCDIGKQDECDKEDYICRISESDCFGVCILLCIGQYEGIEFVGGIG